jgi:predicted transposase YbfD/YdcC
MRPLADVFQQLTDFRQRRGRRYELGTALTIIFLAILSNENGLREIAAWVDEQRQALIAQFQLRHGVPSYGTIWRVLAGVNVEELEQRLKAWAEELMKGLEVDTWSGIAIDGKKVKHSGQAGQAALHLLSAFSHELSVVLAQQAVKNKTNEIPEARQMVADLVLEGKVVTVDALHTQRQTAQAIVDRQGAYLMTVKANQPTLLADIHTLFSDQTTPPLDLRQVQQTGKARGRVEKRTLYASTDLNGYLDWPAVGQVLLLERQIYHLKSQRTTVEQVYGITSLAPDQLDLEKVLQRWRDHWSIESRLHWVRDVILGEDTCRIHTRHAPHVLACLRNAVLSLLHRHGFHSPKAARRHFALHLHDAIALVCGSGE